MKLRLSPSKLDTFDVCPRQFWYRHVERLPEKKTLALTIGKLYHAVLADVLRSGLTDLEDAVDKAIEAGRAEVLELAPDSSLDALWSEVYQRVEVVWRDVGCYLEPRLVEEHYFDPAHDFAGIIDCLSGKALVADDNTGRVLSVRDALQVVDWKVKTSPGRKRSPRDARVSPQLAAYALQTGASSAAFVEIQRGHGAPILVRVVDYTPAELDAWRRWFDGRLETMRALERKEQFAMTSRTNPLCDMRWCPYHKLCYPETKSCP